MKTEEIGLARYLEQPKVRFMIPVYQRMYDWKIKQCKDFIRDIKKLMLDESGIRKKKNHYFGTIYHISENLRDSIDAKYNELLVIDGQQRITTSMLFIKAIHDLLEDEDDRNELADEYLFLKNGLTKLNPINLDAPAFEQIITDPREVTDKNTNAYRNYQFFLNEIKKEGIHPLKFLQAFKKTIIVNIQLERKEDDPQEIFESINSTGTPLDEGTLIRNLLLLNLPHEEQSYLFENYWSKIEGNVDAGTVSDFIRDYLTKITNFIPKKSEVYSSFKHYKFECGLSLEELFSDLLYHSGIYAMITKGKNAPTEIKDEIADFQGINNSVSFPFLMHVFDDFLNDRIEISTVKKILQTIVSLIFRKMITGTTDELKSINHMFRLLYSSMKKNNNLMDNYYETFLYELVNKKGVNFFVENEKFKESFIYTDIYNSPYTKYIMSRIESYENREKVGPETRVTVEHIMPKTLTNKWRVDLGDNAKQVHSKYLNTIGNLSLLSG